MPWDDRMKTKGATKEKKHPDDKITNSTGRLSTQLLISCDEGHSWTDWKAGQTFEQGLTSVAVPQGLDPDSPLLIDLVEGGVLLL